MSKIQTNIQERIISVVVPMRLGRRGVRGGFSLIELLVVIAIIALLAAVIYPTFATAKESANRHVAISNLDRIQVGVQRYAADHGGAYPPVLFAYSDGVRNMVSISTAPTATAYLVGIYPTYLPDPNAFTDPDNQLKDAKGDVGSTKWHSLPDNTLGTDGTLTASTHKYFDGDAYDMSPLVTGPNSIDRTTLVPRYQRAWTSVVDPTTFSVTGTPAFSATPVGTQGITYSQYVRQVDLPTSAGDTYITADTYHVQASGMVEVLFKDGHVASFGANRMLSAGHGTDVSNITVNAQGVSPSRTWMLTPTGIAQ